MINFSYNLNKHYTFITGCTGHLGNTIAHTVSKLGSNLILTDIDEIKLKKMKINFKKKYNNKITIIPCDLENTLERKELIKIIKRNKLPIKVIVNNAAFVGTSKLDGWLEKFENQSIETWKRCFEVNLNAIFEICQKLSPNMKKIKGSNIINIASMYGFLAPDWNLYADTNITNPAAYSVSKSGVIYLTKWLASELAPKIRVNCVSPGGIFRNQDPLFVKKYIKSTPLNRMANEKDFEGVIAFLSTEMSSYMTGQNIILDGGRSIC